MNGHGRSSAPLPGVKRPETEKRSVQDSTCNVDETGAAARAGLARGEETGLLRNGRAIGLRFRPCGTPSVVHLLGRACRAWLLTHSASKGAINPSMNFDLS